MENQEMQTPLTGQWNDLSKRVQQVSVESARALESAEQARSEATHARFDAEACTAKLHSHRRSLAGLWSVVAVVALALGGVTWYGYRTAQRHDNWFAKLPAWEQTLQGIGDRINATETKLETWAGDWKGVGDRLGKLEKRVTANVQLVRNYAKEEANEVHRQVLMELDNRTDWLQARLSRVESSQESQRAHIVEVQEEVAQVRREMHQQIAQLERETGRELDGVHQRVTETRNDVAATRNDLDRMAAQLSRDRVDFELARGRSQELVAGISMTVKDTNVRYQRVEEGWVQLVPEGRFLWIRSQGIQQPMIFYSQRDSRPYEIVFTRVSRDGAIGYLVHPGGPPVASGASGPLVGEDLSASAIEAR